MMTLSASTWILDPLTPKTPYDVKAALDTYRAAGFEYVDFNLWNFSHKGMPLAGDEWRAWVDEMREHCDKLGLRVRQVHGATVNGKAWDEANGEAVAHMNAMNFRCVEAAKTLGAEWMVMHPFNLPHDPLYSREKAKKASVENVSPYLELAKKLGVGIALENMVDYGGRRRRYCGGDPEELVDLVDSFKDESLGMCIDTGHAHASGIYVPDFIRMAGGRLKCTHIDDNFADKDSHLPPMMGTIHWQDTMAALREIGYEGDFSFELGPQFYPAEMRNVWLRYICELGKTLLAM